MQLHARTNERGAGDLTVLERWMLVIATTIERMADKEGVPPLG